MPTPITTYRIAPELLHRMDLECERRAKIDGKRHTRTELIIEYVTRALERVSRTTAPPAAPEPDEPGLRGAFRRLRRST